MSREALGSLSRASSIPSGAGSTRVNYPGTVGYLAAIGLDDGRVEHLQDIKQPRIYTVTSLAYNRRARCSIQPTTRRIAISWRSTDDTQQRMLLKDARIGDLFNRSDRSLWGIRTFNGICTLVRILSRHSWNDLLLAHGETVYDLDVAPGDLVSASVGEIDGRRASRHEDGVAHVGRCDP